MLDHWYLHLLMLQTSSDPLLSDQPLINHRGLTSSTFRLFCWWTLAKFGQKTSGRTSGDSIKMLGSMVPWPWGIPLIAGWLRMEEPQWTWMLWGNPLVNLNSHLTNCDQLTIQKPIYGWSSMDRCLDVQSIWCSQRNHWITNYHHHEWWMNADVDKDEDVRMQMIWRIRMRTMVH